MNVATDELLYRVKGKTGIITFNRPAAHNALTFAMYDRLGEICASVPVDGSVCALIITGAGDRAFAAAWHAACRAGSEIVQQRVADYVQNRAAGAVPQRERSA